jgi:chemotaxis protein methyltransferase CheR
MRNVTLDKQTLIVIEPTEDEIQHLLDIINEQTSYDFRNYSSTMVKRRIIRRMRMDQYRDISVFIDHITTNHVIMNRLISDFCIHVTEMFRNPEIYRLIRSNVIPELTTLPFVRIWIAGCSTGEEAYSLAILLQEEGILDQCRIYATDIKISVLQEARRGIISSKKYEQYAQNYVASDGRTVLKDFGQFKDGNLNLHDSLLDKITFAPHNLAMDGPFHQFDMIFCRNVMIYFNQKLKDSVHELLFQSLKPGGYLTLGDKESIRFSKYAAHYKRMNEVERIYRKIF